MERRNELSRSNVLTSDRNVNGASGVTPQGPTALLVKERDALGHHWSGFKQDKRPQYSMSMRWGQAAQPSGWRAGMPSHTTQVAIPAYGVLLILVNQEHLRREDLFANCPRLRRNRESCPVLLDQPQDV